MAVSSKYDPQTRIFANDILEGMTRTNPIWPAVFWIPASIASMAWGMHQGATWYATAGLFGLGVLMWTLWEYILHRWVFHYIPKSRLARRYYYLAHQVHHDKPEADRLVMPVLGALMLSVPILLSLRFVFGPTLMWSTFAGVIVGYLAYDYVHYFTHFGKPKGRIGKGLRRRHLQHHHAFHDRWYGVSSPLWDYIFRTHVKKGDRPSPPKHEDVDWARPPFTQVPDAAE